MVATLGRLDSVPLRQVWAHEASDFTPWLAEADNLSLLAETLGLGDLQLEGTELSVASALSCAGALHASPSRLPLFRAPHGFREFGARLGRRLQEPQQQRVKALCDLVIIASLITHVREDSMTDEPPTATRTFPTFPTRDEMQATFDAYAAAVGRLAYNWNLLHEKFGRLFFVVTGMAPQIAFAIWYSTEGDRQGDLIVAWAQLPRSPGQVFYGRLQEVLTSGGFDLFVETACRP